LNNRTDRGEKTLAQEDRELERWLVETLGDDTLKRSARAAAIIPTTAAGKDHKIQCLIVSQQLKKGIVSRVRRTEREKIDILQVDTEIFEKDLGSAFLGDLVAVMMLLPYQPVLGYNYLRRWEKIFKKRVILEGICSLLLEYGPAATELMIDPLYFPADKIRRIASFHPEIEIGVETGQFPRIDKVPVSIEPALRGFSEAFRELHQEGVIQLIDGELVIRHEYVRAELLGVAAPEAILRDLERTARWYIAEGLAKYTDPVGALRAVSNSLRRRLRRESRKRPDLVDPERYIYFATSSGKQPLSPEISSEEMAARSGVFAGASGIRTTRLRGVLNSVFVMESSGRRVIAKRFNDWSNLKWFPLSIWAIGVRDFALIGKNRMANEYAFNRHLHGEGFCVPNVLNVAWRDRTILEEYVEGSESSSVVNRVLSGREVRPEDSELIRKAARTIAQVHEKRVGLGDCKPENMILKPSGDVYLIDLEQAEFGGDPSWDIAEFLFYSCRYALRPKNVHGLCRNFIEGYLEVGSQAAIRRAASPRYLSIFAPVMTLPVMIKIARECKKASRA